jgi:hypothetical protein
MRKSSEKLKGTSDMMKEINNTQGRYLPVWMQSPNNKLKTAITKGDRRPRKNAKSRK